MSFTRRAVGNEFSPSPLEGEGWGARPGTGHPPVGILIVNYNGGSHLAACLTALERQTVSRHRFEVIVLDNSSCDGSADSVPARFPWVRLVRSPDNLGFAEGNNVAARHAHGDTVILLNNDTIPDPYWLEELLRATAEHPGHSPASKLVFADRPAVLNSAGLCLLRDGRGMDVGYERPDDGRFEAGGPVFAGCGAAVVLRKDAAGDVLDSDYFLYYEDLDAGWRNELAGTHAVAAPRSLVRHVHGAAAGEESPVFRFHVDRNRALASLRNADFFLAVWSGFLLLAKVPQAFVKLARGKTSPRNAVAVLAAFVSYLDRLPGTLVDRYLTRNWLPHPNGLRFPPPLRGRVRVGGGESVPGVDASSFSNLSSPPTLTLPLKGGGNQKSPMHEVVPRVA